MNKLDLLLNATEKAREKKARRNKEASVDPSILPTAPQNRTRKSWEEIVSYWQYLFPQAGTYNSL